MGNVLEVVVGLQFGDEGKGKIVDERVAKAKENGLPTIVPRFQGGANAGHTLYVRDSYGGLKKLVLHSAPSGLAHNVDVAIGPDVAFNPLQFLEEIKEADSLFGYDGRIMISERTGILFDYHKILDAHKENGRKKKIGTTISGIGPFYQDVAARSPLITFEDYISEKFPSRMREVWDFKHKELMAAGFSKEDMASLIDKHESARKELKDYSERLEYRLQEYVQGGNVIIEGAQGTMLDVVMGSRPDVTSSHLTALSAFATLGLSRKDFKIYGIEKVYPTRVGGGSMPTYDADLSELLVENAGEKGATTGRVRRSGHPDLVMVARSAMLNDCDGIYLTRVDCVQDIELKVCRAYDIEGKGMIAELPLDLRKATAVYDAEPVSWKLWNGHRNLSSPEEVDGQLASIRKEYVDNGFDSLPDGLKNYLGRHEQIMYDITGRDIPIVGVSIGPARGETVLRKN